MAYEIVGRDGSVTSGWSSDSVSNGERVLFDTREQAELTAETLVADNDWDPDFVRVVEVSE